MIQADGPLRLGSRGTGAKAICVFVHGRGQSPEDMRSHVLDRLTVGGVAFVLPRAPTGAWYQARAVDPLTAVARAELAAAIDHLAATIAGFSQGACLAIEYLCAGLPAPEALAALTGCRVGAATDGRPEALPKGLPVYLSGGDADPWIPVAAFADTALSLGRAGAGLRADLFPGRGHEVSEAEILMLDAMLADLAAGRRPQMGAAR